MHQRNRTLVLLLLTLAVLLLAACGADEEPEKVEPALVEEIAGSEFNRVILTEKAAERLGIETSPISEGSLIIPYSAVIYGLYGETWAYTNPEPLTYIRAPITVDRIDGGQAFLLDGPPAGMKVVTVGAQMLYGTDTGVGK